MFIEIAVVVLLTILNGILAMSELAVVSSRPARLKNLGDMGSLGARLALKLAQNPGHFLSTVQIGITLVGVLSGAFSGATLGARLSLWLEAQGLSETLSDGLGVGFVVVGITYLSLIIGELVPKQIALRDPERIASNVAPAMVLLARVAAPLVWLLDISGRIVLALLGHKGDGNKRVTEEEVKTIIAEAESAGVLEHGERDMITGVMRLGDRSARNLMTPRRDVEILNLEDDVAEIRAQIRATKRSRLPVQEGALDAIIGVISVKDAFEVLTDQAQSLDGASTALRPLIQKAPVVLDSTSALDVVSAIRTSRLHMTLVFDEYGHFEGIVTSGDVLEAIAGEFLESDDPEPAIVTREDGSLLVSGWMPIDEFSDQIGLKLARNANFSTVAGYILSELSHLPRVGEVFERGPWRFEIVDMDGRRIDKILLSKPKITSASE